MRSLLFPVIFFTISFICGCASGYKAIKPETLTYVSTITDNSVILKYKYGVLTKRYAVRERKQHLELFAVSITNNSNKDLVFGKDVIILSGDKPAEIIPYQTVYKQVKQRQAVYLLYLLLTPARFNTRGGGQTSTVPIGYAVGPGLTLANMVAVNNANNNLRKELLKYDLNGTTIKKGQTVYGLAGIHADSPDALKIRLQ